MIMANGMGGNGDMGTLSNSEETFKPRGSEHHSRQDSQSGMTMREVAGVISFGGETIISGGAPQPAIFTLRDTIRKQADDWL